ncbi:hypothetical protein sscle_09g073540 [Sclerotinia sclerotiorum 1980 UF-70]|uniref:GATA-type domain-containing protein n=1 Tax=Sclerotinia sclerotiorum (strain ATCC 18683 / 1980 / Ss-1) TaxID=665079 RepID=A0A1D9QCA5_SCLS1|nr:hypothetical protein sscle_09g073540 [Sclerotinia sclerotiorum 1980 UF-70]
MSFGWSAGDIAQAISVIFKTVKALDDAEGAPADFRNTVTFFQSVNLTLQRLQSLISIGKNSSYGDQIRKEVEIIKPSLERFLAISQTFESSLGDKATPGRWKHIPKKLLWRFKDSKAVRNLKSEIKDHLPVLDKWMLLSMIEIIQDLPAELQKHFTGVLNDQMVSILQLQLNPIHDELRMARTEGREHYKSFFSEFEQSILKLSSLQLDIASQSHTTQRNFDKVMSKLENKTSYDDAVKVINEHTTNTLKDMFRNSQALPHASFQQAGTIRTGEGIPIVKSSPTVSSQLFDQEVGNIELLRKVYYMILLYAGLMARNILLRLANLMEPSRALNPVLLPKYHITFRDALGRRPRILQYDTFMNFKVFQAFLLESFIGTIGRCWVERGSYLLENSSTETVLSTDTWSRSVFPGCRVGMAMVVGGQPSRSQDVFVLENKCPASGCSGTLRSQVSSLWQKCSLCQMEVRESDINDVDERSNAVQEQSSINTSEAIESDIIHFSRLVYLTGPNRCHSCNGPETSEWKTQPDGARTLCNACESNSTRLNRYEMMEITEMLRGLPSRSRGSALGCRGGL